MEQGIVSRTSCFIALWTLCAAIGAASGADAPTQATPSGGAQGIEGRTWRVTRVANQTEKAVSGLPRPATLKLAAGRLQAFGGCNRFTASYTLDGDKVTFGAVAGTMMACPEPVMAVEGDFKAALTGTLTARASADGLSLIAPARAEPVLVFVPEPPTLP